MACIAISGNGTPPPGVIGTIIISGSAGMAFLEPLPVGFLDSP